MFIVYFPKSKTYLGNARPMRTKSSARKFESVEDAIRVIKLITVQFGEQGDYMIKPAESTGKKVVL